MSDTLRIRPATPREGNPNSHWGPSDALQRVRFSDLLRQRQPDSDEAERLVPGQQGAGEEAQSPERPETPNRHGPHEPLQGATSPPRGDTERSPASHPPNAGETVPPARPERTPDRSLDAPVKAPDRAPDRPDAAGAAGAARPDRHPAVQHLAESIAGFCNDRGVAGGNDWRVRIELDDELFPATTLDLALAPQSLALRFDTEDDASRRTLTAHRGELDERLRQTLSEPRDISIEVW